MDPLLALAIQNLGPGNTSQCMNRLLPHKRLGLLGEVMSDGARTAAELPSCAVIDYTLEYGSQQRPARLRSEQWRKCLSCGLKSSLQPSEFSSGSERLRAATEAASLVHLGAAGVKQVVNDRPIDARLRRHSVDLPVVALITGSSTRGHDITTPAEIQFLYRGDWHAVRRAVCVCGRACVCLPILGRSIARSHAASLRGR